MAERRRAVTSWADLTVPEEVERRLRTLADEARRGAKGRGERPGTPGASTTALFIGPSGSGKAAAAEAIASDLRRDLYRIDLAAVVSKYIGETEKELSRLLAAAQAAEVVLLIDEADALFGDRTDVREGNDRYANLETGQLLARIEAFGGIVILASNRKGDIDAAFLRRLRYIVDFSSPTAAG